VIPHLIELQDYSISVRTPDEVLVRSPGFANIAGKTPVFGEPAAQIARLHPRQNFNQFWLQLSLDPLPEKTPHFRHSADLAYSHLSALTKSVNFEHGAVIAAPSNYSRTQLSVLLGIVKQCAFDTVGLVDHALLQAASSHADDSIIIDLQLHQAVLTSFRKVDGYLHKDKVIQVPYAGLLALQDAWTGMITDEFIRQSRFDPHHNAETEQYLHNQLDQWLKASLINDELQLEINHKGSVHQARLTRANFEQRSQTIFGRINKELNELRGPSTALHIKTSHMNLPGLTRHIPELIAVDDDETMNTCVQFLQHIRRAPESLQFVTRLPLEEAKAAAPPIQTRTPTHVLFQNKAILLPAGRLTFGIGAASESARIIPVPDANFSGAISLLRTVRGVQLELHTANQVLHNGNPAESGLNLQLGDKLQINQNHDMQLIVVEGA
jgi:hypothetical protein